MCVHTRVRYLHMCLCIHAHTTVNMHENIRCIYTFDTHTHTHTHHVMASVEAHIERDHQRPYTHTHTHTHMYYLMAGVGAHIDPDHQGLCRGSLHRVPPSCWALDLGPEGRAAAHGGLAACDQEQLRCVRLVVKSMLCYCVYVSFVSCVVPHVIKNSVKSVSLLFDNVSIACSI